MTHTERRQSGRDLIPEGKRSRTYLVHGVMWTAVELSDGSLVFSNHRIARRVRSAPRNWMELADDELQTLSWSL